MATTDWILGLGIMFALAILMSYLTYKDGQSFIVYLTIFCGFVVWSGLLETWVLVVMLIALTLIIINVSKRGKM